MATQKELREALDDYISQAKRNERVSRSLRGWDCNIYIEATDIQVAFTMLIKEGLAAMYDGQSGQPDLIIRGSSEDLTNIFWCDADPASNYMQGALKIQGAQENMLRLDAMAYLLYQEVNN